MISGFLLNFYLPIHLHLFHEKHFNCSLTAKKSSLKPFKFADNYENISNCQEITSFPSVYEASWKGEGGKRSQATTHMFVGEEIKIK